MCGIMTGVGVRHIPLIAVFPVVHLTFFYVWSYGGCCVYNCFDQKNPSRCCISSCTINAGVKEGVVSRALGLLLAVVDFSSLMSGAIVGVVHITIAV